MKTTLLGLSSSALAVLLIADTAHALGRRTPRIPSPEPTVAPVPAPAPQPAPAPTPTNMPPTDPNCTDGTDNDSNSGLPKQIPVARAMEVMERINSENPALLQQSCVEHGGNNDFLFRVISELRKSDPRWGLNWKRGNVGDMSQDVIAYYRGAGPFSNGLDTHIIDVIVGHCGPSPRLGWGDVTGVGGVDARWTIAPMPRCDGSAPPPAALCGGHGGQVNNGYPSQYDCEASWSYTRPCDLQGNGCWKPRN